MKRVFVIAMILVIGVGFCGCVEDVLKLAKYAKYAKAAKAVKLIELAPELQEKYHFPTYEDEIKSTAELIYEKVDYDNPIVRNFAVKLASKYPGDRNIMQLQAMYSYVKPRWRYVSDPQGFEYFAYASETIKNNFAGDCDDYAILMAALGEATGFRMRILFGCSESECHAFPEAYLGPENNAKKLLQYLSYTFRDTIHYSKDGKGNYWLSLDWTSNHIGGKYLVNKVYIAFYPAEKRYEVLSAK
ncbi:MULTISPECIES: transglutaminase domain-containing protein [unclassified Archaeoglobus]|jgi:transglutaminase-like putative cysteine protease|uniref:transglutaminase domain-containing protein n=1 Tax=unclassified Archaeoglobus TaxID=2643606 RepID=UPI0025C18619|nr:MULTISPECIES: transglutaminase domain-containing protein [unclassified Archaeoglobus]